MKKTIKLLLLCMLSAALAGCAGLYEGKPGDIEITLAPGNGWIHAFSSTVNVPPTYAIWLEDESGRYISTVYITKKAGTEGWIFNSGNRRKESLPVWAHSRNIIAADGIYLPTKESPMPDAVTAATPKDTQIVYAPAPEGLNRFWLYCEINHSTDFNSAWPIDASEGDENWSGGKEGSGQPSLVYRGLIDLASEGPWELSLYGRGDAAGENGSISSDFEGYTTAFEILGNISVNVLQ